MLARLRRAQTRELSVRRKPGGPGQEDRVLWTGSSPTDPGVWPATGREAALLGERHGAGRAAARSVPPPPRLLAAATALTSPHRCPTPAGGCPQRQQARRRGRQGRGGPGPPLFDSCFRAFESARAAGPQGPTSEERPGAAPARLHLKVMLWGLCMFDKKAAQRKRANNK